MRGGSIQSVSQAVDFAKGGRTVIMRVFEGGDGSTSGGRSERLRESGDLLPEDARERTGEGAVACMFAMRYACRYMLTCRAVCGCVS